MTRLIPRFILFSTILAAFVVGVLAVIHHIGYTHFRQQLLNDSERVARQQIDQLHLLLQEVRSDVLFLAGDPRLRDSGGAVLEALAATFLHFSEQKRRYDQVRFIDREGMERIRVNFNSGSPTAVAPEQLQDKANRYYFREAIELAPGEIYISPLDLNVEHDQVEVPLKPTIRVATPTTGEDGRKNGTVVLNYLGRQLLEHFRHDTRDFPGRVLLLNGTGHFFVGFRPDQEWGFMFPGDDETRLAQLYPEVWNAMQQTPSGHLHTAEGLFTFTRFPPLGPDGGETWGILVAESWNLLAFIPEQRLQALALEDLRPAMVIALIAFLVSTPVLWLLLWNGERRRRSEAMTRALSNAMHEERDAFVGGPTVVFKWRNRFGWPVEHVSDNVQTVLGFSAASFTGGEITYASIIAPDYQRQFADETLRATRDQRTRLERAPYQVIDADGQRLWLQDFTNVVRDGAGHVTHFVGYVNDITTLKETEQALEQSKEQVQRILDAIADPTLVVDIGDYRLELVNHAARKIYLAPGQYPLQMTCHQLSHNQDQPCSGEDEPCPIRRIRETRRNCKVVHRHFTGDGRTLFVEVSATPVLDERGEVVRIIESHRDITRHVQMERELKHLAETDILTQVHNRLRFNEELARAIRRARDSDTPLTLVMLDIDHFKSVNDEHGHDVGDRVLQQFTRHLRNHIRRSDVLARWGGEEFTLLLPDTGLQNAGTICEHLRRAVADEDFPPVGRITASFGVTALVPDDTPETLIKRVDDALYRSKNAGRNRSTTIEGSQTT